ncbi:MAG: glycosyltransferase family 2 protein [Bacteroidales bacterium]|nr:glycosyltransferase family 2 protein [Bacteroidales bacterium]
MIKLHDISVVVPIFNEELGLPELYDRLVASLEPITPDFELIFVNDASRDNSLLLLRQLAGHDKRVKFISFSRNFGHQIAVTAGLEHSAGKAVVIIDGDLQDPPELIPEMVAQYQKGFKVVYARRRSRTGESFFKKLTAKLFYRILVRLTGVKIPIDTGDFRLIDRVIVEQLKLMPEPNKFLRGQIAWMGFRQTFVEFDRDARKYGKTGYPLSKMLRFALDGITAFSDVPLKLATTAGFAVSFIALLVIIYALIAHFFLDETITGWTSLIVSSMFIGGIQLISIGIIGEYISRINNSVRQRPLYIVEESNTDTTP